MYPACNHQFPGPLAPSVTETTNEASISPNQGTGQQAHTQTRMNNPPTREPGATVSQTHLRPRNVPRETLDQLRRQKQSLKIASLNMNGTGSKTNDKWGAINNVMKQRKIAILAIQESHPNEETQRTVQRRFQNSLQIYHSTDPDEPGSRNGVSIAVNKRLVKTENLETRIIMEGRAMSIHWGRGGLETGDYMLGTFRAHVHLSHNVTSR